MTIFEIQQDFLTLFDELEENGGELTPEIEEKLKITEESFKDKVEGYVHIIKELESNLTLIESEAKRLANLKKSKQNTIDRLKNIMADAISKYGSTSKSGGKYLDYGTGKVSVKNTKAVELNTHTIDAAVDEFFKHIKFLQFSNQLYELDNLSKVDMINACKLHVNKDLQEDPINITTKELDKLAATISLDITIPELMEGEGLELLKTLVTKFGSFKTKSAVTKTSVKEDLENGSNLDNIAKINFNKSVIIK